MRTVGSFLRKARKLKRLTIEELSDETKIKKSFLSAIESREWHKLPEFQVVVGFVKSMASVLGLDRNEAVALLRRDYPPQKVKINPNPDIAREFRWSPRLTFLLGIGIVMAAVLGYLAISYSAFFMPPELAVEKPKEGEFIKVRLVEVTGITSPEATVIVNTQPAFVDKEGNFSTQIEIDENTSEIQVFAISRSGKKTEVNRKIEVEL